MSLKIWISLLPYFIAALAMVGVFWWGNRMLLRNRRQRSWQRLVANQDPWASTPDLDESPRIRRATEAENIKTSVDTTRWNIDLLRTLEWKRFELVSAAYFEALGFRALTTRAGADGGVDIHLYSGNAAKPAMIVQCKAWNKYKVGIKPIRELFGVMASEGVTEGIFLTTGHFTQEAREFHKGDKLHLWDGPEFLRKIGDLATERKTALLRVATKGDFTTPTCPSCGIKMVTRTAKRNREQFWGCRNYPRCKQTFN